MCGIVGLLDFSYSGMSPHQFESIFCQMLYANALRGMHGTGIFAVDREGTSRLTKIGGPPSQLFATKEFDGMENFIRKHSVRFAVGHNRYATRGEKTTANAHPFRSGHITLVHNGTLDSYKHLPDQEKYAVDSAALTHAIAEQGAMAVIPSLEGAWTLVWWNGKDETLNILRNEERPLYMATPKKDSTCDKDVVAFASESTMLDWILDRNYIFQHDIDEVPANTLLTFSLTEMLPKVTELKGKETKKAKWIYHEDFSAHDACATGQTSVSEADKPKKSESGTSLIAVGSPTGDWNRGRTGRVASYPVPKKVSQPKGTHHDWVPVESLHDVSKGHFVTCEMQDYSKMGAQGDEALFKVVATSDKYPDVEFHAYVKGEKLVDELITARFGIRGKVVTILKSQYPPAQRPHVIHLHDTEPMHVEEPEVPAHAIH